MCEANRDLWGFRLSFVDAFVILAAVVGTVILWRSDSDFWWLAPLVVGHFFLFCNVFRVRRVYELIWALCFFGNVCFWLAKGRTDFTPVLLTQFPFTLAAIFAEMRSWRYHGIFADRLNPRLKNYIQYRTERTRA